MKAKRIPKEEKKGHHLWGIYCEGTITDKDGVISARHHMNTWHYIRPCANDRRALIKVNTKLYSQLEIREEDTGRTTRVFTFNDQLH